MARAVIVATDLTVVIGPVAATFGHAAIAATLTVCLPILLAIDACAITLCGTPVLTAICLSATLALCTRLCCATSLHPLATLCAFLRKLWAAAVDRRPTPISAGSRGTVSRCCALGTAARGLAIGLWFASVLARLLAIATLGAGLIAVSAVLACLLAITALAIRTLFRVGLCCNGLCRHRGEGHGSSQRGEPARFEKFCKCHLSDPHIEPRPPMMRRC